MSMKPSVCIAVVLASAVFSITQATAAEIPDRCAHAYAAASYRFGAMVSAQASKVFTPDEMTMALRSIELARGAECPIPQLTQSIDCAVDAVQARNGGKFEPSDAVSCVEAAIGREFPQIGN